jgi:acetyl-CoA/propionyl-CoA carboxylase, biotin carboxylase, biotin carboxyl carrier protein
VTRRRVSDRATGTVLGEVDPASGTDPSGADGPAATPSATVTPLATGRVEVVVDGWRFDLLIEDADRADLRARATRARGTSGQHGPIEVRAIIPGRVTSVAVAVGDAVTAGTRLLAVEAMKMENDVRSPRDGAVERVLVAPGQTVELGDVLVVIA